MGQIYHVPQNIFLVTYCFYRLPTRASVKLFELSIHMPRGLCLGVYRMVRGGIDFRRFRRAGLSIVHSVHVHRRTHSNWMPHYMANVKIVIEAIIYGWPNAAYMYQNYYCSTLTSNLSSACCLSFLKSMIVSIT